MSWYFLWTKCSVNYVQSLPTIIKATVFVKEKQEDLQLPKHKLLMNCKIIRISKNLLVQRLLEQRSAIIAILLDERITKNPDKSRLGSGFVGWEILLSWFSAPEQVKADMNS